MSDKYLLDHFYIIFVPSLVLHKASFSEAEKEEESRAHRQIWGSSVEAPSQSPEQAVNSASSPQPLDYESCDQYDLKVEVQNEVPLQAAAPRAERDQARVSVQVRDVNEAPVFQENPLRTSLAEGAAPGTPVATFSARDPDTQQLQRLRCLPRGPLPSTSSRPTSKQRELIAPFPQFPARARSTAESSHQGTGQRVEARESQVPCVHILV